MYVLVTVLPSYFSGYGRPLKVTCGPTAPSHYTKPIKSTTMTGTTFHQDSSEIPISSPSTKPTSFKTIVASTVKPTTAQTYTSVAQTQGDRGVEMTTLTNRITNTVTGTPKNILSDQERTEEFSSIRSMPSSVLTSNSPLSTKWNNYTTPRSKTVNKTTVKPVKTTYVNTFHSEDLTVVGDRNTPDQATTTKAAGKLCKGRQTTKFIYKPKNTCMVEMTFIQ